MAQNHVILNIQDFMCPICLDLLKDPITIPCGHNYCQGCLWEYRVRNNDLETVNCPQCRKSFTSIPFLGKNILLAETVDRLRRTRCSTSPAIAASVSTATNVRPQRASPSTATNIRQQGASASRATNVQPQGAAASRPTNVRQQRASASRPTNVRQQGASASRPTNVQPQGAADSRPTNVRQQRASAYTTTNVRQQRAAASTATNVQQQGASASRATNVQPQGVSASRATNVQPQGAAASTATNVRPQGASASTAVNVRWPRVLAMLLACVAYSVALDGGMVEDQSVGMWCLFSWEFSFIGTLLVLLMELCKLPSCIPVFWKNFPITFACFASLLCLTASITFALHFVKGVSMHGVSYNYCVVSLVFSCFATIAYVMEVNISKARSDTNRDSQAGYMATKPGLLKVCETFVAIIIFIMFIGNSNAYESHAAIKWCMAVYCICFIMSSMVIILSVGNCSDCLTLPMSCFLSFNTLLAVIMYLTATIIWPIYKFDKLHGGSSTRPSECSSSNPGLCPFDKLIVVTVLTSVNFILYLADLIYSVIQCKDDDQNSYSRL